MDNFTKTKLLERKEAKMRCMLAVFMCGLMVSAIYARVLIRAVEQKPKTVVLGTTDDDCALVAKLENIVVEAEGEYIKVSLDYALQHHGRAIIQLFAASKKKFIQCFYNGTPKPTGGGTKGHAEFRFKAQDYFARGGKLYLCLLLTFGCTQAKKDYEEAKGNIPDYYKKPVRRIEAR